MHPWCFLLELPEWVVLALSRNAFLDLLRDFADEGERIVNIISVVCRPLD
jgi:hypothetical protein